MPRKVDIRIRRGAQATFSGTLGLGEPGFTTDTKRLYIGDGISNILIGPTTISGTYIINYTISYDKRASSRLTKPPNGMIST